MFAFRHLILFKLVALAGIPVVVSLAVGAMLIAGGAPVLMSALLVFNCAFDSADARHLVGIVCGGLRSQCAKYKELTVFIDFSKLASTPRKDQFGKSTVAFNALLMHIEGTVREVRNASRSVAGTAALLANDHKALAGLSG